MRDRTLTRLVGAVLIAATTVLGGCADLLQAVQSTRNQVVNGDAEDGKLTGWTTDGQWAAVADGTAAEGTHAFAVSYTLATRYQVIDLVSLGFTEAMLDAGPRVEMREMIGTRQDCGGNWFVRFELLDASHNTIDAFGMGSPQSLTPMPPGTAFVQVAHTFEQAPPGLRFLRISDGGRDDRNWAGFYGPHFDDAVAIVSPR